MKGHTFVYIKQYKIGKCYYEKYICQICGHKRYDILNRLNRDDDNCDLELVERVLKT